MLSQIDSFLRRFPGLSRNIYHFAKHVNDRDELAGVILNFIRDETYATEDQLFWMAKLSEEFLSETDQYRDIIFALFQHQNATNISRAKILEIPEQRFGMPDLREEHLRVGKSDWLAWSAAVGCRGAAKLSREPLSTLLWESQLNEQTNCRLRCFHVTGSPLTVRASPITATPSKPPSPVHLRDSVKFITNNL